ncbi:mucin-5AC-like isoform X2 [Micropterus salmoides]|uniref:mucin-5AC-like isoform X2 n=1 Tax=Micropterus salmoides TaxID=27706 RepID=UPI0018EA3F0B|nr:mucin-5AC-like isoform X2 [Micropterus salmoides]
MDNRLIFAVLLVTLSWISVGYAQTTTTAAPTTTITTAAPATTTTAAAAGATTSTGATTTTAAAAGATTSTGATTTTAAAAGATTSTGATTTTTAAAGATTSTGATTTTAAAAGAPTATTTAAGAPTSTAAAAGATTSTAAAAGATTTTAAPTATTTAAPTATTTAPPLTPNTTVTALQTPLSRTGCGAQQLCAAQPSNCDPSSGSCFFLSAQQQSGQNFMLGLSGRSAGYIAASLAPDTTLAGNVTTYVCAKNGSAVQFFSTFLNNGTLIPTTLNVSSVKGKIDGTKIQCKFDATVPDQATKSPNLALVISNGTFNSTSGALGKPDIKFKSGLVDLGNPIATVPLFPNTTVTDLQTPLSRTGCGAQQLCAAEPSNCDPSSGSCFFLSAQQQSGQNFMLGLSGQSAGYIAASLAPDTTLAGDVTTYVCANKGGVVKFFSTFLNNGKLIATTLNVNSVKGKIDGTKIQCTFAATVPTPTTKTTNLALVISNGTFDSTTDVLGNPDIKFRSSLVDVGNPIATVTLFPNTTVTALQTPLSRTGCGTQQLCAAQPSNCDPSSGSCFFLSAQQQSGQNFMLGLSGQSAGYIAASLAPDTTLAGNVTTYVCAKNGSAVQFFSTFLNSGKLIPTTLNVNSVKGRLNGTTIQCTFAATVPDQATKSPKLAIVISSGTFDISSGALGNPVFRLRSGLVDLANPNATVTNLLPSSATAGIALQQSVMQALLITVGVLGLAIL